MSQPPKSTMRAPSSTWRSYKGVRLPKNFSPARPRACQIKRAGKGIAPFPRPSVLVPERSGSPLFKERGTAPLRWMLTADAASPLSRTRLRSLPFFCLSVSGRKLAPSAPSLKRVSRTESGQLASGWHDSSPFPVGPAERAISMRRFVALVALFAVATTLSGTVFAKNDARVESLKAAETARFKANVDADTKALGQLLDDDLEYVHSNGEVNTKKEFIDSLVGGKRDYIST